MGQGLSAFNQPAATTALMRRMHPARAMGVSELTAAESGPRENEARTRRRLALLRGRYGVAEESGGQWRLRFSPEWMDAAKLPRGSLIAEEVSSALDVARETAAGVPVFCEMQTRGRGRRGRRWLSIPAGAILFAVRVPIPKSPLGLPLAVGVGILRALESVATDATGGSDLKLKWPNDILDAEGRKVGGVLVEGLGDSAAVGAGVNLLMTPELRAAVGCPVAGMVAELGGAQHRNVRARAVAERVAEAAAEFGRNGVKSFLDEALSRHVAAVGGEVSFRAGDGRTRRGEFAGFGVRGELLLRGRRGTEAHISGEFAEDENVFGG